jgi:protein SCO1/2
MNRRRFLLLSLLLAACRPAPVVWRNTDLTGAGFARQFSLTDHNGQPRKLSDFHGKAVVLFFGYTACPDVCPTTLTRLAAVMKALGAEAEQVQVLFVTLDPERDSIARLKEFAPWFHPAFLGLRSDPGQLKEITEEFRIFSSRKPVDGALGYVIDHSSGAYVYDPAGRLRLYVKDTVSVEDIAADLRQLLGGA